MRACVVCVCACACVWCVRVRVCVVCVCACVCGVWCVYVHSSVHVHVEFTWNNAPLFGEAQQEAHSTDKGCSSVTDTGPVVSVCLHIAMHARYVPAYTQTFVEHVATNDGCC